MQLLFVWSWELTRTDHCIKDALWASTIHIGHSTCFHVKQWHSRRPKCWRQTIIVFGWKCENLMRLACVCVFYSMLVVSMLTYLSTPSAHRTPCARPHSIMITAWQTNWFDVCVETDASIIARCHLYDGNVITVRPIPPKLRMHNNRFDTKSSLKHVKLFQIMISNDQMQVRLLWDLYQIWHLWMECINTKRRDELKAYTAYVNAADNLQSKQNSKKWLMRRKKCLPQCNALLS